MSYFNESQTLSLKKKLNFYLFSSITLLASNVLLAGLCWYTLVHQKIEVTPFFGGEGYVKSDTSVDGRYLTQVTENFINARLNVTPHNIKANHKRLLNYVDSSVYHNVSTQLLNEQKKVTKQHISSYFDIESITPNTSKLNVEVIGTLRRFVGQRALHSEKRLYLLTYKYHLGRLSIQNFECKKVFSHE